MNYLFSFITLYTFILVDVLHLVDRFFYNNKTCARCVETRIAATRGLSERIRNLETASKHAP